MAQERNAISKSMVDDVLPPFLLRRFISVDGKDDGVPIVLITRKSTASKDVIVFYCANKTLVTIVSSAGSPARQLCRASWHEDFRRRPAAITLSPDAEWLICVTANRLVYQIPLSLLAKRHDDLRQRVTRRRSTSSSLHVSEVGVDAQHENAYHCTIVSDLSSYFRGSDMEFSVIYKSITADKPLGAREDPCQISPASGTPVVVTWWRSSVRQPSKDYLIIGTSRGKIVFFDVESNKECLSIPIAAGTDIPRVEIFSTQAGSDVALIQTKDSAYFTLLLHKWKTKENIVDCPEDKEFTPRRLNSLATSSMICLLSQSEQADILPVFYDYRTGSTTTVGDLSPSKSHETRFALPPNLNILFMSLNYILTGTAAGKVLSLWTPASDGDILSSKELEQFYELSLGGNETYIGALWTPSVAKFNVLVWSRHYIYELVPLWSPQQIDHSLRGGEISVATASKYGRLIGLNMDGTFLKIADEICAAGIADDKDRQRMFALYSMSRARPLTIATSLRSSGSCSLAAAYIAPYVLPNEIDKSSTIPAEELEELALLYISCLAEHATLSSAIANMSQLKTTPGKDNLLKDISVPEHVTIGLNDFLTGNCFFDFHQAIEILLDYSLVYQSLLIGKRFDVMEIVLHQLSECDLLLDEDDVHYLVEAGASRLLASCVRLLDGLPIAARANFVLSDPEVALLCHDWILRNINDLPDDKVMSICDDMREVIFGEDKTKDNSFPFLGVAVSSLGISHWQSAPDRKQGSNRILAAQLYLAFLLRLAGISTYRQKSDALKYSAQLQVDFPTLRGLMSKDEVFRQCFDQQQHLLAATSCEDGSLILGLVRPNGISADSILRHREPLKELIKQLCNSNSERDQSKLASLVKTICCWYNMNFDLTELEDILIQSLGPTLKRELLQLVLAFEDGDEELELRTFHQVEFSPRFCSWLVLEDSKNIWTEESQPKDYLSTNIFRHIKSATVLPDSSPSLPIIEHSIAKEASQPNALVSFGCNHSYTLATFSEQILPKMQAKRSAVGGPTYYSARVIAAQYDHDTLGSNCPVCVQQQICTQI